MPDDDRRPGLVTPRAARAARLTGWGLIVGGTGVIFTTWDSPTGWVGVAMIGLGAGAVWRASGEG